MPVGDLPLVQWAVGTDSLFHYFGLGLLADKDAFYSNSSEVTASRVAPFTGYREQAPELHALMALLSGGPVTPSDAVGATNETLVRSLCRADGLLLKPSRPATASDWQIQAMAFGRFPATFSNSSWRTPVELAMQACDANDSRQRWAQDQLTNSTVVALTSWGRCLDVAGCNTSSDSPVDAFYCQYSGNGAGGERREGLQKLRTDAGCDGRRTAQARVEFFFFFGEQIFWFFVFATNRPKPVVAMAAVGSAAITF